MKPKWTPAKYPRRILEGVRSKNLEATISFVNFAKAFDSIHREKMEQILLVYSLPKETIAAIMMLNKNTKVKIRLRDEDTNYFDTLATYLFIICLDYVLRPSIDLMKENGFKLAKEEADDIPHKLLQTRTMPMT